MGTAFSVTNHNIEDMPNWKKVITSGSDASLNSLNVASAFTASGIIYPTSDGLNNQSLITDGAGNLTFGNPYSDNTVVYGKNLSGTTIEKGTPLYFTGSGTGGNLVGVFPADASNPARMPAGGIAGEQMLNQAEGVVLLDGFINGVDTSAFDSGDLVYVGVGGGYTNVAPTGSSNLIQSLGYVEKINDTNGSGVIKGPGVSRSVPNIQQGYVWVGNADDVPTPTATSSLSVASATQTSQAITFNNEGTGAISGTTFNGSTARTISYNTIGAQPLLTNPVTGTGTTNYLPKFTGTSALGNSLVYDDGTNVGIGTTNPSYKLDVNGNFRGGGLIADNVSGTLDFDGNLVLYGNLSPGAVPATAALGVVDSGIISDFPSSEAIRIKSNGNVGIGTGNPVYKLDVNGTIRSTGTSTFGTSGVTGVMNLGVPWATTSSQFNLSTTSTGNSYIVASNTLSLKANNTTAIRIDNTGSVGIGTTSPQALLNLSSGTQMPSVISTSTDFTGGMKIGHGYNINGFGFTPQNIRSKIEFQQTSPADYFGEDIIFSTTPQSLTPANTDESIERMRITKDGNVGIGTTTPTAKLDITDGNAKMVFGAASSDRSLLYFQHNAVPVDAEEIGLLDFRGYNDASEDTRYVILTAKAEDVTDGSEDGSLTFQTMKDGTATQTMTLRSGRVGIGTTSPSYKLDVNGNFRGGGLIADNVSGQLDFDGNPVLYGNLSSGAVPATATLGVVDSGIISEFPGSEVLRIRSNGRVGIGTTNPGYTLDVSGTIRSTGNATFATSGATGVMNLGVPWSTTTSQFNLVTTSAGNSLINASNKLSLSVNSTTAIRIDNTGNVGIGTTSPQALLNLSSGTQMPSVISTSTDFTGGMKIGHGYNINGFGFTPQNIRSKIEFQQSSSAGYIGEDIIFSTTPESYVPANTDESIERMRITKDGNVGIGTTSPGEKLTVSGNISATGTVTSTVDMRAPIFYDSNDTGYYIDPNGTTVLNNLTVNGTVTGVGGGIKGTAVYMLRNYSDQNISRNTIVKLEMDTIRFDDDSNYNTGTYEYTAPEAGEYLMTGRVTSANFVTAANGQHVLYVYAYVNGSSYQRVVVYDRGADVETVWYEADFSFSLKLSAGDKVDLRARFSNFSSTSTLNIDNGADNTFYYITKIG